MVGLIHPSQRSRPVRDSSAPRAGPMAAPRPALSLTAPAWGAPAFPLAAPRLPSVVQRVTEPPSGVTVVMEEGTGRVLTVTNNDTKGDIPFVVLGAYEGDFTEGTAVLTLAKNAVSGVRFASADTKASELGAMKKVKFTVTTVPKVEGLSLEPTEEEETVGFPFAVSTKGGLLDERFTGFEVTPEGNQGDIHYEKHGAEFGASSKLEYIKKAKEFGEIGGKRFCEAILKNTLIRVDPEGMEQRRVFIANGKKIRTFYIWDPRFSSDPFAYAIYYTMTHNLKIPLLSVDPKILGALREAGVDVFAMEREVVRQLLEALVPIRDVQHQTLAPLAVIKQVIEDDPLLQMTLALGGGKSPPQGFHLNIGEE